MFSLLLATHLSYRCLYTSVGFVAKLADVNERWTQGAPIECYYYVSNIDFEVRFQVEAHKTLQCIGWKQRLS